jgi:hypothetical protein
MTVPDSREVVVPLPPQAKAPGFRDAFSKLAGMRVRAVTDDWLAISPREDAGAVYEYFRLQRLCDAASPPDDDTWAPLLADPPLHADEELWPALGDDGRDMRQRLSDWAEKIDDPDRPEAHLAAVGARLTTLPLDEVPAFLTARAREFVAANPDASFWFMRTDDLLIKRFAMLRALLAVALAPDVIDENDPEARDTAAAEDAAGALAHAGLELRRADRPAAPDLFARRARLRLQLDAARARFLERGQRLDGARLPADAVGALLAEYPSVRPLHLEGQRLVRGHQQRAR